MKRLLVLLAILVGSFGWSVSPAGAHAVLDSSSPAPSTVLSQPPGEIALDFSETVEQRLASIRLFDAEQREIEVGRATRLETDPSSVVATLPLLGNGVYVVVWRVLSADGHSVTGAFPFEVGDQSSGRANDILQNVVANLDDSSSLGVPLGVMRFATYLGAITLVGLVVLGWGSALAASTRFVRVMTLSLAALVIGTAGVLFMHGAYVSGGGWADIVNASLVADVVTTRLGLALIARLVLGVLWFFVIIGAARGLADGAPWKNAAFLLSVGTIVTFSVSGHASAVPLPVVSVATDIGHMGALSVWIGGLIALATAVRGLESDQYVEVAQRYSRLATWAMPATVVTGVATAVRLLGGLDELTSSDYGKLLLGKVALVVVVVLFGVGARRRLAQASMFRRVIAVEVVVAIAVFAVTTVMLSTAPQAAAPPQAFSATLVQDGVIADIAVTPAEVGTAEVHVLFNPPGGALAQVKNAKVQMSLPERDIPAIPVDMVLVAPNHYTGVVQIPYEGRWDFEVRASPQESSTLLWSTTLDVIDR